MEQNERIVDNDRLVRIENKLDKVSDAIVAIARTEEQIASILNTQRSMQAKQDTQETQINSLRERTHDLINQGVTVKYCKDRIGELEADNFELKLEIHDNSKVIKRIEKITWLIVSAVVSSIFYLITRGH